MAVTLLAFLLKIDPPVRSNVSLWNQLRRLDPPGQLCLLPSVICLLLALQWGGTRYAWSNPRIVTLLILFVFLTVAFWVIQGIQKENATVRLSIIRQRTVAAATIYATLIGGTNIVLIYWLAIWFQTVKGVSALSSGIHTLPLAISWPVSGMLCGTLVTKFGWYQPPMYLSCVLLSAGTGLMTTFGRETPTAQWIGYQIVFGCGLGIGTPQASVATQNSLSRADTPVGITLMLFAQSLGGAVLNAIAQAVYERRLQSGLRNISGLDPKAFVSLGATNLRQAVPGSILTQVVDVYANALRGPFFVALIASAVLILPTLAVEWKKLPPKPKAPQQGCPQGPSSTPMESDEAVSRISSRPPSLTLPESEPFDVQFRVSTPALTYRGAGQMRLRGDEDDRNSLVSFV
ncbi:hypothetical protein LTR17_026901 [Elasticomyces elasticus]|nr:hypothetical protein LTR17_026901 [Elasticomyces elasticus]